MSLKNQFIPTRKVPFLGWMLLLFGLLLTGVLSFYVWSNGRNEDLRRFKTEASQIEARIRTRIERYEGALIQTRAFFLTKQSVSREEFHQYVENLGLLERYPGIQGLGYTVRLLPNQLGAHIRSVRSSGLNDYRVWPAHQRNEYFSILYLEPMDWRNLRAIGFDMFTEPTRRQAMERARDTGLPALTQRVTLVQEVKTDPQPGFLLYVPLYKKGASLNTVEQRREALEGFIYSPFRANDLFDAIFAEVSLSVDFKVYDGTSTTPEALLYEYDRKRASEDKKRKVYLSEIRPFEFGGLPHTLSVSSLPVFRLKSSLYAPLFVGLAGILVTLLLFRILLGVKSQAEQNEATVRERDRSLETLATINQMGQQLTSVLELDKLVQLVTDAATRLSGAQFGAFFYKLLSEKGEEYTLYSISGVPREAFTKFPLPRGTEVFHPTFMGEGTVRSDNIREDPRYGKNAPHHGMPEGHLPVTSYLAVSVISRTGEVLGGLFFGHEKAGIFTEQSEKIVEGLASQAAVALDNAKLYRNVQESVRARDEFLSIASHELKTPLTSLKLQTQLRARSLAKGDLSAFSPERLKRMIEGDTRQVERLARLIDDMLDTGRINTGKLTIQSEPFDLCELATEVLERYLPQFEATGSKVSVRCQNPVVGTWDRFRIEQVLVNLFTNAMKYGGGKPVEISLKEESNQAILTVQDYGMGIAKENHERIFQRFERAISASEISGLGLGLFIVRQIVDMHGGTIQVVSELGQGATFIVKLPKGAPSKPV